MNTFKDVWNKLAKSKKYRESFALAFFKRMVPFQVRALRKQRGWSQAELAENANVTQGVISRAEDPDYGNLTINTISRIAAGFDVAFIVKFVPFSELDKRYLDISEESVKVPNFDEENAIYIAAAQPAHQAGASLYIMKPNQNQAVNASAHVVSGVAAPPVYVAAGESAPKSQAAAGG